MVTIDDQGGDYRGIQHVPTEVVRRNAQRNMTSGRIAARRTPNWLRFALTLVPFKPHSNTVHHFLSRATFLPRVQGSGAGAYAGKYGLGLTLSLLYSQKFFGGSLKVGWWYNRF